MKPATSHLFPLLNTLAYRMSWLGSIFSSIPTTSQDTLQDDLLHQTSTTTPPPPPPPPRLVDNTIRVAILLDGDADYVNLPSPLSLPPHPSSLTHSSPFILVHTSLHFKRIQRRQICILRPT